MYTSRKKQNEICAVLAKATILAPVSFYPNLNNPICNPFKWDTRSCSEEEILWTTENLGDSSPRILSQTKRWVLTQHFGLRGRQEHHSMEVEDDCGTGYITFREHQRRQDREENTKRRTVLPKMFATSAPRCPVQLFQTVPKPTSTRASRQRSVLAWRDRQFQNRSLEQEAAAWR